MFIDSQELFSDSQAITATAASTNLVDLGAIRDLGLGENIYVVVACTVAMTDASSDSTVTVTIETDDSASFGSATTTQTIGAFAAVSAAGTQLIARLGIGQMNERFARLKYTVANGNLTTGSFDAFLTHDIQKATVYADAITIS